MRRLCASDAVDRFGGFLFDSRDRVIHPREMQQVIEPAQQRHCDDGEHDQRHKKQDRAAALGVIASAERAVADDGVEKRADERGQSALGRAVAGY